MTHHRGRAFFTDGTVLHFEYDSGTGTVLPWLYAEASHLMAAWRSPYGAVTQPGNVPFSGLPRDLAPDRLAQAEDVVLEVDELDGSWWPGKALRGINGGIRSQDRNGEPSMMIPVVGVVVFGTMFEDDFGHPMDETEGLYRPMAPDLPADHDENCGFSGEPYRITGTGDVAADIAAWYAQAAAMQKGEIAPGPVSILPADRRLEV